MNLLNFFQIISRKKIREFIGLKSPCLKYSEIAKEMGEAAREGQEETYKTKWSAANARR